jgi:hypothetical protein
MAPSTHRSTTTICSAPDCDMAEHPVENTTSHVRCFLCNAGFHLKCAVACGYEDKKRNILWVCNQCYKNKAKFKSFIETSMDLLRKEVMSKMTNIDSRLTKIESLPKGDSPIHSFTNTAPSENIQVAVNKLESRDRQYNIVLYGLPIEHDDYFNPYPMVERVFDVFGVPKTEIRDAVVLRRYNLVKVTLYSLRYRRILLSDQKKLREDPGEFKNTYINPDLTFEERRRNKQLRDLVKDTAKRNPAAKVFIKNKSVLIRNPDGSVSDVPIPIPEDHGPNVNTSSRPPHPTHLSKNPGNRDDPGTPGMKFVDISRRGQNSRSQYSSSSLSFSSQQQQHVSHDDKGTILN